MGTLTLALAITNAGFMLPTFSFDGMSAKTTFTGFEMKAEERSERQAEAKGYVRKALYRYPSKIVDRVFLVRNLWIDGAACGGTASTDGSSIILALGDSRIDATWVEETLHHELAHALMYRIGKAFPKDAWLAANGPAFRYSSGSGVVALKNGESSLNLEERLLDQGVLSTYGASSFNEDWATFAERVLSNDPKFWATVEHYPRVKAKARLAIEFYRKAIPGIKLPIL